MAKQLHPMAALHAARKHRTLIQERHASAIEAHKAAMAERAARLISTDVIDTKLLAEAGRRVADAATAVSELAEMSAAAEDRVRAAQAAVDEALDQKKRAATIAEIKAKLEALLNACADFTAANAMLIDAFTACDDLDATVAVGTLKQVSDAVKTFEGNTRQNLLTVIHGIQSGKRDAKGQPVKTPDPAAPVFADHARPFGVMYRPPPGYQPDLLIGPPPPATPRGVRPVRWQGPRGG